MLKIGQLARLSPTNNEFQIAFLTLVNSTIVKVSTSLHAILPLLVCDVIIVLIVRRISLLKCRQGDE